MGNMKKHYKIVSLILVSVLSCSMFASCGNKKAAAVKSGAKVQEELNPNLELTYSSWQYSSVDESVYYAFTLTNKSTTETCTAAKVKITMFDADGDKADEELVGAPRIEPEKTVTLGTVGMSSETMPSDVKFEIEYSGAWSEYAVSEREAVSLVDYGMRDVLDTESEDDEDYFNFEDEFEDIGVELEDDSISEAADDQVTEYYGTVFNNTSTDIESVLVCVIYKDGAGNILSGECTNVSDVPSKQSVDFTLDSCSGLASSNYEMFMYVW